MAIGELIFVGEGKTKLTTVLSINANGAKVEFTWEGEVIGSGKAEGVKGGIIFTGRKIAPFSGLGKGTTSGLGILFTGKEMIAIKSSGYGNPN
jgi:hypothetical protein